MKKKMNIKKKKEKERQHFTVKMLCDVFFFTRISKKSQKIFLYPPRIEMTKPRIKESEFFLN